MDYPLNGYYDRFPTVIYLEPTVPAQRHMSFVSAGIHNSGITSYNEAGLFLASHVVPSLDVSLRGVPAFVTADLAIRRARTFDAATGLFQRLPSASGWSYGGQHPGRKSGRWKVEPPLRHPRAAECVERTAIDASYAAEPFLNRSVDEAPAAMPAPGSGWKKPAAGSTSRRRSRSWRIRWTRK
jgi:hypothetical protein